MKKFLLTLVFILIVVVGWYAISPLFDDIEVNDAEPVALVPEGTPSGMERLSPEEKVAMEEAMIVANAEETKPMDELRPNEKPSLSVTSTVIGTLGHPAEGTVRIIPTTQGQVIRFEDFSTINGPNLHLYLAKDLDATEFVDLGPIRGTEGNINYVVPADIDLSEYKYVMHWCVPFGVLFNYANLEVSDS